MVSVKKTRHRRHDSLAHTMRHFTSRNSKRDRLGAQLTHRHTKTAAHTFDSDKNDANLRRHSKGREVLNELGRNSAQVRKHLTRAVNHIRFFKRHALILAEFDHTLVHKLEVVSRDLHEDT